MLSTLHHLKLEIAFCDAVYYGAKNFEIRNNEDRGFQKGDRVRFFPVASGEKSNHDIVNKLYEITYVMNGYGLQNGYVVFGFKEVIP